MAIRTVRAYPDDILRKKSRIVENIDERILVLLEDMVETMYKEDGAGLAAPQVGVLKRIVVIDVGQGPITLINPEIIEVEGDQEVVEGCLSIKGKRGRLMRPAKVKVRALNEKGEEIIIEGEEELAKALCHEIDHLDGVLYIDKVIEMLD